MLSLLSVIVPCRAALSGQCGRVLPMLHGLGTEVVGQQLAEGFEGGHPHTAPEQQTQFYSTHA